jgi:hypothetical protein
MVYLPWQVEATASHLVTNVFTRLPMSFLKCLYAHGDCLWWMQRVANAVRFFIF